MAAPKRRPQRHGRAAIAAAPELSERDKAAFFFEQRLVKVLDGHAAPFDVKISVVTKMLAEALTRIEPDGRKAVVESIFGFITDRAFRGDGPVVPLPPMGGAR